MAMDQELKRKWVEALRSGEYKQGKRALRRDDKFCCLGVLCDVMGAEWQKGEDVDLRATLNGVQQNYYLDDEALQDVGMTEDQQETLYLMNDGSDAENNDSATFPEIADYIEANL